MQLSTPSHHKKHFTFIRIQLETALNVIAQYTKWTNVKCKAIVTELTTREPMG